MINTATEICGKNGLLERNHAVVYHASKNVKRYSLDAISHRFIMGIECKKIIHKCGVGFHINKCIVKAQPLYPCNIYR